MNRTIIKLFFYLCILTALPSYAQNAVHYYFKTMDIRNGLSQNTVYQILQDRKGFMWFGTKDGLNRYDGLSYRVYKKENSGLGKNFITALYEDHEGNIWIGTDGGVFIYNPVLDSFTAFNQTSDKGTVIKDFVTMIGSDEYDNIWISVENQGLFCYNHEKRLRNYLHDSAERFISVPSKYFRFCHCGLRSPLGMSCHTIIPSWSQYVYQRAGSTLICLRIIL